MQNLGTIFKVCYNPDVSITFLKELRKINPSMSSNDEQSAQYSVDFIYYQIDKELLEEKDIELLKYCEDNNIDYIEI